MAGVRRNSPTSRREQRAASEREKLRRERSKRQREKEQEAREKLTELAEVAAVAKSIQRAEFAEELERYQIATVQALLENQRELDAAEQRLQTTLGEAAVLPDGRRVFRTENGLRVFDSDGAEVGADELDPDIIPDNKPRWETYSEDKAEHERLTRDSREPNALPRRTATA